MYWGRAILLFLTIVTVLYGTSNVFPQGTYTETARELLKYGTVRPDYSGAYKPYGEAGGGYAAQMTGSGIRMGTASAGTYTNPDASGGGAAGFR